MKWQSTSMWNSCGISQTVITVVQPLHVYVFELRWWSICPDHFFNDFHLWWHWIKFLVMKVLDKCSCAVLFFVLSVRVYEVTLIVAFVPPSAVLLMWRVWHFLCFTVHSGPHSDIFAVKVHDDDDDDVIIIIIVNFNCEYQNEVQFISVKNLSV